MITTPPAKSSIVCEVLGKNIEDASALAEIATVCARDVAQALVIKLRVDPAVTEHMLTLRLPAALAIAQHPIWCLASRLACFFPNARVSVLVEAETTFAKGRNARRRRMPQATPDRSAA